MSIVTQLLLHWALNREAVLGAATSTSHSHCQVWGTLSPSGDWATCFSSESSLHCVPCTLNMTREYRNRGSICSSELTSCNIVNRNPVEIQILTRSLHYNQWSGLLWSLVINLFRKQRNEHQQENIGLYWANRKGLFSNKSKCNRKPKYVIGKLFTFKNIQQLPIFDSGHNHKDFVLCICGRGFMALIVQSLG